MKHLLCILMLKILTDPYPKKCIHNFIAELFTPSLKIRFFPFSIVEKVGNSSERGVEGTFQRKNISHKDNIGAPFKGTCRGEQRLLCII